MPRIVDVPRLYEGTPFRYPLIGEFDGRSGKIMRLAHDGRVVRAYAAMTEAELEGLRAFTTALAGDGVAVPHYEVVRGPRLGRSERPGVYVVCDWVVGERLDLVAPPADLDWQLPIPRRFYRAFYEHLDGVLANLIGHYRRLLQGGGLVFTVMDESQFVYGRCPSEKEPSIYFVDLDPTYRPVPCLAERRPGNDLKSEFEKPLDILFEMMLRHPGAALDRGLARAREYFAFCSSVFTDFYGPNPPAWSRPPHFRDYQRLKGELLLD